MLVNKHQRSNSERTIPDQHYDMEDDTVFSRILPVEPMPIIKEHGIPLTEEIMKRHLALTM